MNDKTIFEKIIDGEIPADLAYEDDRCIVIHDLNPQAPTHLLIIPRKPIPRLAEASESDIELLGHLLLVARDISKKPEFSQGFRIVINNGPHGGESVPHLHVHLFAGRQMTWPPG